MKAQWFVVMVMLCFLVSSDNFEVSAYQWQPLEGNSSVALDYGRFAIEQHNKLTRKILKFESVVDGKAMTTPSEVLIVRLNIKAKHNNNKEPRIYSASINEPLSTHIRRLVYFSEF